MHKITKKFEFSAAHHLPDYDGDCANTHGHNYGLEVCVTGTELDDLGILIDFKDLNKIVQENVLQYLDHTNLNDTIEQPTAENIAKWIYEHLEPHLNTETYSLDEVIIQETPDSKASYRKSES